MSFLPYGSSAPGTWIGSLGASALSHAGLVAVVLYSGTLAFLPDPAPLEAEEETVNVSLLILDAEIIEEIDPEIPEDAVAVEPDEPEAESADEAEALAPVEDDAIAPEEDLTVPDEPDVVAPEPVEPVAEDIAEDAAEEPPLNEAPAEAVVEDVVEAIPEDIVEAPAPAEPAIEEVVEEDPIIIADVTEPEDTVINPLADAGGGGAPVEPDTEGDTEPDLLALAEPEEQAQPIIPEPIAPEDTVPAVLEPEVLQETLPEPEVVAPEITEIAPQEPEVTEPEVTEPEIAAVPADEAPAATDGRPVVQNPTPQDRAIGTMIRRIRALPDQACTLALPRRLADPRSTGGLTLVGADIDALDRYAGRITDDIAPAGSTAQPPVQTRDIVDTRQCAALDALRQSTDYPVSRLGLSLSGTTLSSGDTLSARVLGAGGLFLTLLVIDDNGVVQDLAPFTTLDGDIPVIEVPVARSGPTRATRQLLLALGTPEPLNLQGVIGEEAQDVFTAIPAEQLRTISFAVASLDVR